MSVHRTAERLRHLANSLECGNEIIATIATDDCREAADRLVGLEAELEMWRGNAKIEQDRRMLAEGRLKVACCAMRQALHATMSTYMQRELRDALSLCDDGSTPDVAAESKQP